jgi:hypothetical protein
VCVCFEGGGHERGTGDGELSLVVGGGLERVQAIVGSSTGGNDSIVTAEKRQLRTLEGRLIADGGPSVADVSVDGDTDQLGLERQMHASKRRLSEDGSHNVDVSAGGDQLGLNSTQKKLLASGAEGSRKGRLSSSLKGTKHRKLGASPDNTQHVSSDVCLRSK